MNTNEVFQEIIDEFDYNAFQLHPYFIDELRNLLSKELSGQQGKFLKALVHVLYLLKEQGLNINNSDGHERLKYGDGHYYSLHLQQKQFNIRFLVYITDDKITYFLCAFYERSGKSRTDYTHYVETMRSRLDMLKGETKHE